MHCNAALQVAERAAKCKVKNVKLHSGFEDVLQKVQSGFQDKVLKHGHGEALVVNVVHDRASGEL